MLNVIKSFHDGMHGVVRVGSITTGEFEIQNGLRQGGTIAPSIFNVYFSAMVSNWRPLNPQAGIHLLYKHGRKLVSLSGITQQESLSGTIQQESLSGITQQSRD